MDNAKKELVDKLKSANNILLTVSRNPTVDQLASCLGLALLLNKQGKHTAAVFSGQVPSTIEFLKPEDTLEKNTDSLRDFIIALDKSKADKLRYKVEDNVVRIFITPYKTSISEEDLDFSQGDFNVDLVVALGVDRQEDLDEAITAHGRILHDAVVASVNIRNEGGLGSINWHDPQASSLSELITDLIKILDASLLDSQIATALLTGIVSATDRFSNDKTSSQTMSASATLMAAGANQQLVASKLEESAPAAPIVGVNQQDNDVADQGGDDGAIAIQHDTDPVPSIELPTPDDNDADLQDNPPQIDPSPSVSSGAPPVPDVPVPTQIDNGKSNVTGGSKIMDVPPSLGGTLTANSQVESLDPVTDPMSMPASDQPLLEHKQPEPAAAPTLTPPPSTWGQPAGSVAPPSLLDVPSAPPPSPINAPMPIPPPASEPPVEQNLSDLEKEVKAAEVNTDSQPLSINGLDTARDEVNRALSSSDITSSPGPIQALNAQPMVDNLHLESSTPALPGSDLVSPAPNNSDDTLYPQLSDIIESPSSSQFTPPSASSDDLSPPPAGPQVSDPNAPPPVPPPIPFQFGGPNQS